MSPNLNLQALRNARIMTVFFMLTLMFIGISDTTQSFNHGALVAGCLLLLVVIMAARSAYDHGLTLWLLRHGEANMPSQVALLWNIKDSLFGRANALILAGGAVLMVGSGLSNVPNGALAWSVWGLGAVALASGVVYHNVLGKRALPHWAMECVRAASEELKVDDKSRPIEQMIISGQAIRLNELIRLLKVDIARAHEA